MPLAKNAMVLPANFNGSWEMDYVLNDSVEAKLDTYFYRMRRRMERQSGRQMESERGTASVNQRSAQTVLAMAQFVEKISRPQVMDIEQTVSDIRVEREGTFALTCQFGDRAMQALDNPFGTEVCGWDGHQLVFQLRLPEGLVVQQRLTLSQDGQQINVATTMMSDQAPEPFTLNRSYSKFDKRHQGFECEQTVRKGKVCTLRPAPEQAAEVPEAPKPVIMNAD